jgi:hypothetical protein
MTRSAEAVSQAAKIAEFKRLITSGSFETLEKLEEAVDAFFWEDEPADESADELWARPRQAK